MTRRILAGILLALGGLLPQAAWAQVTYTDQLQGIEVSAGIRLRNVRLGATFVGSATGQLPGGWSVSINYTPPAPGPNVVNTIVGGTWALTVIENGRPVGTLFGTVSGGTASWDATGSEAAVNANVLITGGTGRFAGANGTGNFEGVLSHLFFPPRIGGTFELAF